MIFALTLQAKYAKTGDFPQYSTDPQVAGDYSYYQSYYDSYAYAAAYGQMIAQGLFPNASSYDGMLETMKISFLTIPLIILMLYRNFSELLRKEVTPRIFLVQLVNHDEDIFDQIVHSL